MDRATLESLLDRLGWQEPPCDAPACLGGECGWECERLERFARDAEAADKAATTSTT